MTDIVVIGGGASGMMAAVAAKKAAPKLKVLIVERQSRVGRKLLATGNGRCNITNKNCESEGVYNSAFASRLVKRVGLRRVLNAFREMGLECDFDADGRAYPQSEMASSVVDALRLTLDEMSVKVAAGKEVKTIARSGGGFVIRFADGETLAAKRVIIACGGAAGEKLGGGMSGYALLKSLGHRITPLHPSLSQLRCDPETVRGLKGIKKRCEIALEVNGALKAREVGEVLFCDYGLSGIASMALSREAGLAIASGKNARAVLRLSEMTKDDILKRAATLAPRALDDFLSGIMPKRLGQQLLKQSGVFPLSRACGTLASDEAARLASALNAWRIPLTGVNGFSDAQVTSGGADVKQFSDDLESLSVEGLFAAGEVLDVDAPCGGFNLHWAWASGITAGESAARHNAEN